MRADRFKKGLSSYIHKLPQSTLAISTDTFQTTYQIQALPYPKICDEGAFVSLQRVFMLLSSPCSFICCLMESRKVI